MNRDIAIIACLAAIAVTAYIAWQQAEKGAHVKIGLPFFSAEIN